MNELMRRVETVEAVFRERVGTEAGLGWVAYPSRYLRPNGGILFKFCTADHRIQFPSIDLSAEELAAEDETTLKKLAWRKWREWRAEYEAKWERAPKPRRQNRADRLRVHSRS